MFFFSLVDSHDQGGGELSTIGVAAAIAGPMCFICGLIMLFICWHQKRQLKKQEHFNEAEAALKPMEVDEAVIPSGQTLKELMDMSTGENSHCKTAVFESSKQTLSSFKYFVALGRNSRLLVASTYIGMRFLLAYSTA